MTQDEIIEMAKKCGWDNPANNMAPLYEFAKLVAAKERNFCSRCGKRTADLTTIHTCTPPHD
jgi:hypothetical protein